MGEKTGSGDWPLVDEKGDFIWRFPLEPGRTAPTIPDDAFAELVRSQLDEMLKLVCLTWKGERIRVDGFYFVHQPTRVHPIWTRAQEDHPTSASQP